MCGRGSNVFGVGSAVMVVIDVLLFRRGECGRGSGAIDHILKSCDWSKCMCVGVVMIWLAI